MKRRHVPATKLLCGETVISNPGDTPFRGLTGPLLIGPEETGHIKIPDSWGLVTGLWWADSYPQHHLWKLAGALDSMELLAITPSNNKITIRQQNVTACVKPPYVLLIGNVSIDVTKHSQFNVSCIGCELSSCVTWLPRGQRVMVLHQPSFMMLPVNLTGKWYSDKGYRVLVKLKAALLRQVPAIGLIIAGVTALIVLIASSINSCSFAIPDCSNSGLCKLTV